ncbi:hypothetical protein GN956_G96 [Arapaima gigas]
MSPNFVHVGGREREREREREGGRRQFRRACTCRISSRKSRLATPAPETRSRNSQRGNFRKERCEDPHLPPIKESPTAEHRPTVNVNKKLLDLTPQNNQEEHSSLAGDSTNNESTSGDIMPSGVSSFFIDCLNSSSETDPCETTSSNFSSPEVFRTPDAYEEAMDLQVKNSTLLDVSHAVDINMKPPPNLSAILEISRKPVETDLEIRYQIGNSFSGCTTPVSENTTKRSLSERRLQTGKNVPPLSEPTKKFRSIKCQKEFSLQSLVSTSKEGVKTSCEIKVTKKTACEPLSTRKQTLKEVISEVQLNEDQKANLWNVQWEENESENMPTGDCKSIKEHKLQNKARFFIFSEEEERNSVVEKKEGKRPFSFPSKPLNLRSPSSKDILPVFVKFKNSEMHDPGRLYEVCWMQLLHEGEAALRGSRFRRVVAREGETGSRSTSGSRCTTGDPSLSRCGVLQRQKKPSNINSTLPVFIYCNFFYSKCLRCSFLFQVSSMKIMGSSNNIDIIVFSRMKRKILKQLI